jgi:hypothetical protein
LTNDVVVAVPTELNVPAAEVARYTVYDVAPDAAVHFKVSAVDDDAVAVRFVGADGGLTRVVAVASLLYGLVPAEVVAVTT